MTRPVHLSTIAQSVLLHLNDNVVRDFAKDISPQKEMISSNGGYIEIYVNTSLEKCEERDAKGLYKLAREGVIKEFTGISDPYEEPINADIVVNSMGTPPEELVDQIFLKIIDKGYLKP